MSEAVARTPQAMASGEQSGKVHAAPRGPTAPDHAMLGIWIFLSAECAFFASLIGTYLALHAQTDGGIGPAALLGTPTLFATLVLLTSSFTMVLGVAALQDGKLGRMRMWLGWTALLGLVFLGFQAFEFHNFYGHGLTLQSSAFGSAFFTLTGFHGMHVAFGVFWIISLIVWSLKQKTIRPEWISKFQVAGLYWHFVDMVWVVIFTVVYLIGKAG